METQNNKAKSSTGFDRGAKRENGCYIFQVSISDLKVLRRVQELLTLKSFQKNLVAMRRMSMAERRSSEGKGLTNGFDFKFMFMSNLLELTFLSLDPALKHRHL